MRLKPGLSGAIWGVLLVLVLAVAGVTHAVAVLALPWRSHRDAFTRLAAKAPIDAKIAVPNVGPGDDAMPFRDPGFVTAFCRYDLRAKPFRLSVAPFASGFVTVGFHSRHGIGFYGFTVRADDATRFDLRLFDRNASHAPGLEGDQHAVAVDAPEPEGFVLIGTPAGDDADRAEAEARLATVQCRADAATP